MLEDHLSQYEEVLTMCQATNIILENTIQNHENQKSKKEAIITDLHDRHSNSFFIKRPAEKDYIEALLDYTEKNIADSNLTLKNICENVLYMNTDYISKQFIQEIGIRYTAYLCKLRIDKAKTLIPMLGKKRLHRVAEEIGFGNSPQYFSRIFKKNTGLTPTEYLNQTMQMVGK